MRASLFLCLLLAGCEVPGRPKEPPIDPLTTLDVGTLYTSNCQGCHGPDGKLGPAPPLNDPIFLAIIAPEDIAKVLREGRAGTSMPSFRDSLTEAQRSALANGLRDRWPRAQGEFPPYHGGAGNSEAGRGVFTRSCAGCHGSEGQGDKAGSVTDPSFLALISDRALRRIVITGRPDLGMPPAHEPADRRLTGMDIDDVVAWLRTRQNP